MVDYEERDTKRGLREFEDGDEETPSTNRENGDSEEDVSESGVHEGDVEENATCEEDVVDIDVVRHELEIRPDARSETEADDEAATGSEAGASSSAHGEMHRERDERGSHGHDHGESSQGRVHETDHHEHGQGRHQRDSHGGNDDTHRQGKNPEQGAEEDDHGEHEGHSKHHDRSEHHDHSEHHDRSKHHDHSEHHHAHDVETLRAAVVTVSSTRTMNDDPSGEYLVSTLLDAGHEVVSRELIADDFETIQHTVEALVGRSDVELVVTTGGTGVTPDDQTVEAIQPLFEKELPGFGELFRALSYEEIGARTVATRATAGVIEGVSVFCLPGSRNAVELGVDEIILEVAPHVAGLATRDEG